MPLQGPAADPLGSTTARVYGLDVLTTGSGGGEFAAGGGLRLSHQFTPDFSAGVEGAYVNGVGTANALQLAIGRAHGKYSFLGDHLAFIFGVGAEYQRARNTGDNGTEITGDVGLSAGGKIGPLDLYAVLATTVGFPTWSNPTDQGFIYGGVGLGYRPAPQWHVGAELASFFATYSGSGLSFDDPILRPDRDGRLHLLTAIEAPLPLSLLRG